MKHITSFVLTALLLAPRAVAASHGRQSGQRRGSHLRRPRWRWPARSHQRNRPWLQRPLGGPAGVKFDLMQTLDLDDDGATLRGYLRAITDAGADAVLLTSFNEWPETTIVEPSSTWPDPYLYLKILAEWKGVPFAVPSLPDRVRKGGNSRAL